MRRVHKHQHGLNEHYAKNRESDTAHQRERHGCMDRTTQSLIIVLAKMANDIRTDKRVGLLKKRTKKDGNAQRQQLLPNDTLRYIDSRRFLSHTPSPPAYVKQHNGNLRPKPILA